MATHQPPSVTHQPPSVTHQPPSVTHQPIGYPPTAIGYPPTAIGYPPTAIGYTPTAIGYTPTAIGYPPTAISYPPAAIIGRIGHSEFFFIFYYGNPCLPHLLTVHLQLMKVEAKLQVQDSHHDEVSEKQQRMLREAEQALAQARTQNNKLADRISEYEAQAREAARQVSPLGTVERAVGRTYARKCGRG